MSMRQHHQILLRGLSRRARARTLRATDADLARRDARLTRSRVMKHRRAESPQRCGAPPTIAHCSARTSESGPRSNRPARTWAAFLCRYVRTNSSRERQVVEPRIRKLISEVEAGSAVASEQPFAALYAPQSSFQLASDSPRE